MPSELSGKVALVCCTGLFVSIAERLARDFSKVYLHVPNGGAFPRLNAGIIGTGLKNVELVDDVFGPHFDEVDLFVFPDLGNAPMQIQLEKMGKRVWGARNAEELEVYREVNKREMEKLGLPVQPWSIVKGVTALEEHLRAHESQHVKIDRWRGVTETFFSPSWEIIEPKIQCLAHDLGGYKEELDFIVEDDLPDCVETGTDCFVVDGQWPSLVTVGVEAKDLGWVGKVVRADSLPEPVWQWNKAMTPVFSRYGARSFISTEIRIGEDHVPYMIDATIRVPSPPGELWEELFANYCEIIWEGANGVLVEPEPVALWGVHIIIKSNWAKENWQLVEYPEEFAHQIKLYNPAVIDGKRYVVPQDEDMPEIGCVVGWGATMEEAVEHAKRAGESITGFGIKFDPGPTEKINESLQELEDMGISPFGVDKAAE
jgi:hypothetical protein